ncbi:MAG: glycosyltransferase family 2 protein [Oscillospiraceae bacterium]
MNDLVSVIVPVYRVEENLLRKSIESIIEQTHKEIEVLIVDDGSPDNCGKICDEYAYADTRVKVFHTENGGVSSARNFALARSKGNYIFFVDSDDYIENNTIEQLLKAIKENDTDCAMCAANHIDEDNMGSNEKYAHSDNKVILHQKEAVEALCYMEQPFESYEFTAIWGCLYKREIIGSIRFNTKMKIGEDFEFKYRVFLNINSVVCLEDKLYNYLIRSKSAMRNGFDLNKVDSVIELQNLLRSDAALNEYKSALQSRIVNIAIVVLFMIPVKKDYKKYREPIKRFLKQNRRDVIRNPKTRKKVKISLLMSYFGFDLVQKLFFTVKG